MGRRFSLRVLMKGHRPVFVLIPRGMAVEGRRNRPEPAVGIDVRRNGIGYSLKEGSGQAEGHSRIKRGWRRRSNFLTVPLRGYWL